ncbi:Digestive cysteine proteinase 3-like 3 [Homarus americanus]|uniref:Digestive cysteine proteinase 3-like 3 n=1 Tax=Homarus americanus TaxID=6706 RepID=A0A8J5MJK9_HOMAM|nr:Digestive cysteine proteinase 3-like 3 [Homarus americanus]
MMAQHEITPKSMLMRGGLFRQRSVQKSEQFMKASTKTNEEFNAVMKGYKMGSRDEPKAVFTLRKVPMAADVDWRTKGLASPLSRTRDNVALAGLSPQTRPVNSMQTALVPLVSHVDIAQGSETGLQRGLIKRGVPFLWPLMLLTFLQFYHDDAFYACISHTA